MSNTAQVAPQQNLYENISFRYPFRDYQKRVLEQAEFLLQDKKLHIVAAPGSGKTVLGLEMIRRLNQKALILVPTVNLRNQWKDRFLELFVPEDGMRLREQWAQRFSEDLKAPGVLTCVTYQALHYLYEEKEEEGAKAFGEVIRKCKELGIGTICLDEAHHLKREWWKVLTEFVQGMDVKLISLTATPPMDTSDVEWKRYMELCGDIDLEIFIPEMVVKKCLCPHQDYLYLCQPTEEETAKVAEELGRKRECERLILREPQLYQEIKGLPFLAQPSKYAGLLIKNPDYLVHVISYAAYMREHYQVELEGSLECARKAYRGWDRRIHGMVQREEQTAVEEWFLPLMKDILEYDPANYSEELREKLQTILTKNHMMRSGRVSNHRTMENVDKVLRNSASKLDGVVEIVQAESAKMGQELRCVVLMDHIRKEDLGKIETEETLTDLGVVSVFERLRRQEHLGNLEKFFAMDTRSNPVVARSYRTRLGVLTGSLVILPDDVMAQLTAHIRVTAVKKLGVTGYSVLESSLDGSDGITAAVTRYFSEGAIEILIGTAALLGEGWDAPAANTLIIGSTSAMYVKTNQMRGRALRVDPDRPQKVSNVWHLMSVAEEEKRSAELRAMEQRFEAILGLSMDGKRVENGMDRLKDGAPGMDQPNLWNHWMKERAGDRAFVKKAWETVGLEYEVSRVRNVVAVQKKLMYAGRSRWLKRKQLYRAAQAIVQTLKNRRMIQADATLMCTENGDSYDFYLEAALERDGQIFASCMKQVASALEHPRYMIRAGFFARRYFAVPDVLATRKEIAAEFCSYMGYGAKLIFVRTAEGSIQLLDEKLRRHTVQKRSVQMVKELI